MKKRLWRLLCLLAALALPLGAFAQQEVRTELEGVVKEVAGDGFLLEDVELGEVWLNTDATTLWAGILESEPLEAGQYVLVDYDGRLTRSLPSQAHADRVACYRLMGTATEFYPSGVLLTGDERFGDVILHLDAIDTHVYMDVPVTAYYDGVMMLSLPGQVNVKKLVVPELTGVVSESAEEGFTLTTEEGQPYEVRVAETTLLLHDSADKEQPAEPRWADGERVTVLYNGMLTKSIPAQLTALEVRWAAEE